MASAEFRHMRWVGFCAAVAAGLVAASQACAAVQTIEYTISASDFQGYQGPLPAPVDPVVGRFDITFDPTDSVDPTPVGLTVKSLNIPFSSAAFAYDTIAGGVLAIATHPSIGAGFAITGPEDFGFQLFGVQSGHPTMGYAQYYTSDFGNYYTFTGRVSAVAVPEPANWTLLIAGFGILGAAARMRRRQPEPQRQASR